MIRQFRSFDPAARLLMVNQFTINTAFYMLMPYLAAHLAGGLGLAAWAVGLVLGMRNFSQQGMFLVGGTLADRLGCKRVIVAGCALRTAGFALLAFADSLPALVLASAATGFAGALFNPAVRAYLATEAGERRVEAFALFNVFYQAGMFAGPLLGLALLSVDFRMVGALAALLFAGLTVVQARSLPDRPIETDREKGVLADWRTVLANRPFLLFSAVMVGSYVLSFQVYLALPLQANRTVPGSGDTVTAVLFAVSALVAAAGQLRITGWMRARWSPNRAITAGILLMGLAFVPLLSGSHVITAADSTPRHWLIAVGPLLLSAGLLAAGTAVVYPFEMDTVVSLANGRLVATHYGLYNTVSGVGITLGNLAVGELWDRSAAGMPRLPWLVLAATGLACAAAMALLARSGRLRPSRTGQAPALETTG
ncbi:MFS transporter [Kitasatospora sp. NPDC098652]|uniref:MFS transporter n=1 Tax=Kitasatospora sp. NPDC098652 TaxID=3364095 RepID=UPI00381333C1